MAFPTVTYTNDNAGSGLVSNAASAGLSLNSMTEIAQLQSVVANLLISDPSTVAVPAGDVLSGTFGANKSGGADTGTYTFPGALAVTGAVTGVTTLATSSTINGQTITVAASFTGSVAFVTSLSSITALATPSALIATTFSGFASTVSGAVIMGFGTTNDVALMNRAGTVVLGVGPNTTTVNFIGNLVSTTAGSELILANTANATNATTGFLYINTSAGTPSGVPANAGAGKTAIQYDTTGHKFWAYDQVAAVWKSVALT